MTSKITCLSIYSFPTQIETIERAVSTIGLRQIRELVLVTSILKAFEGIPSGTVNMETFWEHSLAVGIMARELGQYRITRAPGKVNIQGRPARLPASLDLHGVHADQYWCEAIIDQRHDLVPAVPEKRVRLSDDALVGIDANEQPRKGRTHF